MARYKRRALFTVLTVLTSIAPAGAVEIKDFVSAHCIDCHDDATRKGKLSFESLGDQITEGNAKQWLKVLEQIERRNMPPADKKQPAPAERHAIELALEARLVAQASAQPNSRPAVLRRLNRVEYRDTVRDLLQINLGSYDPTREFPDDNRVHGFPSNGEKLVTSSFLLRQYLEAADHLVARAVHFEPKPPVRHWDLLPPFDRTSGQFTRSEAAYYKQVAKQPQPYQSIIEAARDAPKMGYHPVDDLRDGVASSGWYHIRIRAEGKFRYADLDPKKMHFPAESDPAEPIRLSLFTGTLEGIDRENKEVVDYAATHQQLGERLLATWDLPDDKPTWLDCRVWLDRGYFPRLVYPNGPSDSNNRLFHYFVENKYTLLNKEQLAKYEQDAARGDNSNTPMWFESPRILISKIEVEGPLNDVWPPVSHRAIFGEQPYVSSSADDVLHRFATRAWRRPVADDEVQPIVNLVRAAEKAGQAPQKAIQQGFEAILCSSDFLYREEKSETLSDYEIATRLSYFLWASMPDERLLRRAAAGELRRPEVLCEEADRMLSDPHADAFIDEFLNGWLAMRKLGTMAPDVNKFAIYYRDNLESAMRNETRLFFRQLLRTNGSIDLFLDSDYSFINDKLARLYGMEPKVVDAAIGQPVDGLSRRDLATDGEGHAPTLDFARVKLPSRRRGGLLGEASILTLTANGVDTSPVIRGVWILENILGQPPSPPPPDVPVIEPDIRGAKTIREQLEKHRANATCRSCHHLIDPPGFALETFDAIGRWRTQYQKAKAATVAAPIDSSGKLGDADFKDVAGFKTALLQNHDQFARCLVEKLLVHALGRELEVTDRPAIRHILESAEPNGYRLRDLILLCPQSDIFRRK